MGVGNCERGDEACISAEVALIREELLGLEQEIPVLSKQSKQKLSCEESSPEVSEERHTVERGDTLYNIIRENLGVDKHPLNLIKRIKVVVDGNELYTKYTTLDFKEIEVGDRIYFDIGHLVVERSPIRKLSHIIEEGETLYGITRNVFGLNIDIKNIEKILLQEGKDINNESENQVVKFDTLKPKDIVTAKYVNSSWQYIIERPLKKIIPSIKPTVSKRKVNKEREVIEEKDGQEKNAIEKTFSYAKRLIKELPSKKKQVFLDELSIRLNNINISDYPDKKLLDKKCTRVRQKLGRDFFASLTGKEFETFYRNIGNGNKYIRTRLKNIMGKQPGIVDALGTNDKSIRTEINDKYQGLIEEYAEKSDLDYVFLRAIIQKETKGDCLAISPSGALGLGQHLHFVWLGTGTDGALEHKTSINPLNPEKNIQRTAQHLRKLFNYLLPYMEKAKITKNDQLSVVASAYNMGQSPLRRLLKKHGAEYIKHLKKVKYGDPNYGKEVSRLVAGIY